MHGTEINFPPVETWFICWDDTRENIKAYGSILTTQSMRTPWDEVDQYTNEEIWIEILWENGIDPYPIPN